VRGSCEDPCYLRFLGVPILRVKGEEDNEFQFIGRRFITCISISTRYLIVGFLIVERGSS